MQRAYAAAPLSSAITERELSPCLPRAARSAALFDADERIRGAARASCATALARVMLFHDLSLLPRRDAMTCYVDPCWRI